MIIILGDERHADEAGKIQLDLSSAFSTCHPSLAHPTNLPTIVREEWDDLLLVLFDHQAPTPALEAFVSEYMRTHSRKTAVLPVALNPGHQKPPSPIAHLKSLAYNERARGPHGRLVLRVGGILGLRPEREDKKIFISYRVKDGKTTADAFYACLQDYGFDAWKDEAPEGTNLPEGEDVQAEIERHIVDEANLVLVIDTPDAPESSWMGMEIDWANANLTPVFPIVCRRKGDLSHGPRFFSLRALDRYHTLSNWEPDCPPSSEQLSAAIAELDRFISEMLQRRLKLPVLTRQAFEKHNFSWKEEDLKRALYSATRPIPKHFQMRQFLLHCAYLLSVSPASLEALSALSRRYRSERDFYIYDGLPLPMTELKRIFERARFDEGREPFPVHINALFEYLDTLGGI